MVARINIAASPSSAIFAISKPRINVLTATTPGSFLFNSALGATLFGQPFLSGTISSITTAESGYYQTAVTHNLGFIPLVALFFSATLLYSAAGSGSGVSVNPTTTQLIFLSLNNGSFVGGAYIGYAIMNAPAQ